MATEGDAAERTRADEHLSAAERARADVRDLAAARGHPTDKALLALDRLERAFAAGDLQRTPFLDQAHRRSPAGAGAGRGPAPRREERRGGPLHPAGDRAGPRRGVAGRGAAPSRRCTDPLHGARQPGAAARGRYHSGAWTASSDARAPPTSRSAAFPPASTSPRSGPCCTTGPYPARTSRRGTSRSGARWNGRSTSPGRSSRPCPGRACTATSTASPAGASSTPISVASRSRRSWTGQA